MKKLYWLKKLSSTALCCFNFLIAPFVFAWENKISLEPIPDSLKEHAQVIFRKQAIDVDLRKSDKYVVREQFVITILNEGGRNLIPLTAYYREKFDHINFFKAAIYDAKGDLIRAIKPSEIRDYPAFDGFSVKSDLRVKNVDYFHSQYPYHIVFESEMLSSQTLFLPQLIPQLAPTISVQHATLSVKYNAIDTLRLQFNNCKRKEPVQISAEHFQFDYEFTNIPAFQSHAYAPNLYSLTPSVFMSLNKIKIDRYEGRIDTWAAFGKFYCEINKGKLKLPIETVQKVKSLVQNCSNDREKIQKLYSFMQDTKRYVSVQIGVGGIQCFDASYVDTYGFGDCKALSNYMKALLEIASIPSNVVLVAAGDRYIEPDLLFCTPGIFNHAILCIPLKGDTVWLECTSSNNPSGYLGTFTENRLALVTSENGGYLARTPSYNYLNRSISTNFTCFVNDKGVSKWVGGVELIGPPAEQLLFLQQALPEVELKAWVAKYFEIDPAKLLIQFNQLEPNSIPKAQVHITVTGIPFNLSNSGSKVLLPIASLFRNKVAKLTYSTKKVPVHVPFKAFYSDTLIYQFEHPVIIQAAELSQIASDDNFGTIQQSTLQPSPNQVFVTSTYCSKPIEISWSQVSEFQKHLQRRVDYNSKLLTVDLR